jgi:hypothetical protein
MEGDYRWVQTDRVVPGGLKALRRRIFIVGYLKFVEIKHLHAAMCSTAFGAANRSREQEKTAVCE